MWGVFVGGCVGALLGWFGVGGGVLMSVVC